ncbi:hypothetical protein [Paenibacillus eucommiae]|uniref:Uncharacterized protein n=1 Tax=Paenibacillus eucommiae TaxID=1355755 RepID=A0ABS4J197_9BACL|nr:hypothetical protein [Paenibacillus eucommiae]MBP1993570.1 hypothetical protein [Paenibacillus eucommiae]
MFFIVKVGMLSGTDALTMKNIVKTVGFLSYEKKTLLAAVKLGVSAIVAGVKAKGR